MHGRGLILFIVLIAVLLWLGFKLKSANRALATALFAAAAMLALILIGGLTGLIGG